MNPLIDRLDDLASLVESVRGESDVSKMHDTDLVETLAAIGRLQRRVEAVVIDAVDEVVARSATPVVGDRLTSRFGCHDVNELIQRTTLVAPQTASRVVRAARAVCGERALVSGEALEPLFPAMRAALDDGGVGVDGVLAATSEILAAGRRVSRDDRLAADEALADAALGRGPDAAPPACADLLRVHAHAWATAIDQDGAEPRERLQAHKRGVTLGTPGTYGVPVRGMLLPEVAAQFQHICDALLSPRASVRFDDPAEECDDTDPIGPADTRTRAQKQHDALATALGVAAASGDLPTVGGAAPTLVVSVREEDLTRGDGPAHVDALGVAVSAGAARHVACRGVTQRIALDDTGRIRRLGTAERVFNKHQRRAIALRDGGCVVPGCGVPAAWCEIHHVDEHARGGATHTDNGVLLCWFHHRFLDTHGWEIRMARGVPEVRAPRWYDPGGRWRAVTRSPTRLRSRILRT